MSSVATIATVGSAAVGAYGSYKAGEAQKDAAKSSAQAQVRTNRQNIEFQKEMFEQQREDQAPWREAGEQALGEMRQGIQEGRYSPGAFDFQFKESPGYQFRRDEAIDAVESSAAAKGRLNSGATMKAINDRASDMASQEYGNAFRRSMQEYQTEAGRKSDQFNRQASMAGIGQTANQQVAGARSNMASRVGQSTQATGNALARGARQKGQARASAYQGMAQSANQGMQNYLMYNALG